MSDSVIWHTEPPWKGVDPRQDGQPSVLAVLNFVPGPHTDHHHIELGSDKVS
jgi:hypothetical protein